MCCKTFWKRIVPFAFTLVIALMFTAAFQNREFVNVKKSENLPVQRSFAFNDTNRFTYRDKENGISCGECRESYRNEFSNRESNKTEDSSIYKKLSILSKPKAVYTDLARQNKIQDVVILRVTFLANGQIGAISSVSGLPDGLTEQAISAAKQIKFRPAMKDGHAITVTKLVQYNFTLE